MLYFKYIVLTTNEVPKSKKVLNHSQQKVHVNCYKISVHSSQDKQCICDYVHYMIFIRLFFFPYGSCSPIAVYGLLIHEVSRSHTMTHHSR